MSFDTLRRDASSFRAAIKKAQSVNVNSTELKRKAKSLVQLYFRTAKPELEELGIEDVDLDADFQHLLRLANANNSRASYVKVVNRIDAALRGAESLREIALGERSRNTPGLLSELERRIIATLDDLLPSASLSYRQALADLRDSSRVSFRGTANELREAMREAIDHLAPDERVTAQPDFKFERQHEAPTTAQKVRFILKQRAGAGETAERSATLVDERTASLVRQVSRRSSKSTHVMTEKNEVAMTKLYVDVVLCELLEIPVAE